MLPVFERRNISRQIGLRRDEATKLDAAAKREGKTFSSWARQLLLEFAGGRDVS